MILTVCLYCVLRCFYCCSAVPQVSWLQSTVSTTGLLLCLGKHQKRGLPVLPNALEQALNVCVNTHAGVHINNQQVPAHPHVQHKIVVRHLNFQQLSRKHAFWITSNFPAFEDLRLSLKANLSSFITSPDVCERQLLLLLCSCLKPKKYFSFLACIAYTHNIRHVENLVKTKRIFCSCERKVWGEMLISFWQQ